MLDDDPIHVCVPLYIHCLSKDTRKSLEGNIFGFSICCFTDVVSPPLAVLFHIWSSHCFHTNSLQCQLDTGAYPGATGTPTYHFASILFFQPLHRRREISWGIYWERPLNMGKVGYLYCSWTWRPSYLVGLRKHNHWKEQLLEKLWNNFLSRA